VTTRCPRRWLLRDCQGTTAVEFAVIAGVLLPMLFGSLSLGFLMWTHNALQSTAALTARCVALGACTRDQAKHFAADTAQQWIVPGIVNAQHVFIDTNATSCNGSAGSFVIVTIPTSFWAANILPQPFAAISLQVSACFPTAAD
jgi:hypothetical protein